MVLHIPLKYFLKYLKNYIEKSSDKSLPFRLPLPKELELIWNSVTKSEAFWFSFKLRINHTSLDNPWTGTVF